MPPKRIRNIGTSLKKRQRTTSYYRRKPIVTPLYRQLRPTSERKWKQIFMYDFKPYQNTWYLFNPWYYIQNGSTHDTRVGDRIMNVRLYINITYIHGGYNGFSANISEASYCRAFVFANRNQWNSGADNTFEANTLGSGTTISRTDFFLDDAQNKVHQTFLNKEVNTIKSDVLLQSSRLLPNNGVSFPQPYGVATTKKIVVNLGNLRFTGSSPSYLKDVNYYVGVISNSPGWVTLGNTEQLGQVSVNMFLTWNDS